ncbi:hypothetical protein [Brachyspira innocens]|uniref:adenylate/guanylate cyclase domain-containing protein n=1 Tax=Brachyspira innocens TaxID=13264 RepID=UPI0026F05D37|nr:hypothetical protein [Brachyspira innocens]
MILGRENYNNYINSFLNNGTNSKEALYFNISENEKHIINKKAKSAVIYLDIYDFSSKIHNFEAEEIIKYLTPFYKYVFRIIEKHNGRIDRVMGDGIIAIFSEIFNINHQYSDYNIYSNYDVFNDAYCCCKEIIEKLRNNKKYASKAAIGLGELYFCRLVSENYNEITCIGEPLTEVYRLENIADKNEILLFEDVSYNFPCSIDDDTSYTGWIYYNDIKYNFKGLGERKFNKVIYKSE